MPARHISDNEKAWIKPHKNPKFLIGILVSKPSIPFDKVILIWQSKIDNTVNLLETKAKTQVLEKHSSSYFHWNSADTFLLSSEYIQGFSLIKAFFFLLLWALNSESQATQLQAMHSSKTAVACTASDDSSLWLAIRVSQDLGASFEFPLPLYFTLLQPVYLSQDKSQLIKWLICKPTYQWVLVPTGPRWTFPIPTLISGKVRK